MTREEFARRIHWSKVVWGAVIVNPCFMLPQLWKIWDTGKVEDISILTLVILILVQATFGLHGYFIRDNAVFRTNVAAIVVSIAVLASTLYFLT